MWWYIGLSVFFAIGFLFGVAATCAATWLMLKDNEREEAEFNQSYMDNQSTPE